MSGSTSGGLDYCRLQAADWVLSKWVGLHEADTALINLLVAAGNTDELRTQLHNGIARLQDLPADDDEVKVFRKEYGKLKRLGLAVRDALQADAADARVAACKTHFVGALLVLLLHAEGGE